MSTKKIRYVTLPTYLVEDKSLSHASIRTLLYAQSKRPGWIFNVTDICNAMGYSQSGAWKKTVSPQLRARHLLHGRYQLTFSDPFDAKETHARGVKAPGGNDTLGCQKLPKSRAKSSRERGAKTSDLVTTKPSTASGADGGLEVTTTKELTEFEKMRASMTEDEFKEYNQANIAKALAILKN